MLKKTFILNLPAVLLVILSCGLAQATPVTVATFADPAVDGNTPLFTVDLNNGVITGGWPDSQTGLDLIVLSDIDNPFEDVFFEMAPVSYGGDITGGETGGGIIKFFADGQDTSTTPLIQIAFEKAHLAPFSFGATDLFFTNDSVTITGSELEIVGSLTDESFAFSFANHMPLSGGWSNGYTVTASFTSSAVVSSTVPEPVTVCLLGLGTLALLRKRTAFTSP